MNTEVLNNETTNEVVENVLFEEDIEAAVNRFAAVLGPQGRYLPSGNIHSIRLYSPTYGVLWYGDITHRQTRDVLKLSKEFQIPLAVVRDTHWEHFQRSGFGSDPAEYYDVAADAVYFSGITLRDRYRTG